MSSVEAKSEKVAMIESASSQRLLPTSPEAENAISMLCFLGCFPVFINPVDFANHK